MSLRTEQAGRALALQGVDPGKVGIDWKAYRETQRDEARRAAKAEVLLDEIARRENIEAAEGDVDAEVARFAQAMRKPKEAVRRQMQAEGDLHSLRAGIRAEKTLDLLKANARLIYE
jgi:FKBP-type peptidyl-prolyl cis-trans isomerase (trigger factor)